MRERGLKLLFLQTIILVKGRSREGAWIEIEDEDIDEEDLQSLP